MHERPCGTFDIKYEQTINMAVLRTPFHKIMLGLFLLFLFTVPPLTFSIYLLSIINMIGIWIIVVYGLNILTGYCGQISIGQAAFMMVGAYASAILNTKLGLSFWICLPLSAMIAGSVGLVFGLPSLRIKGFYIAMSTLAAQYILPWVIIHMPSLTGGIFGCPANSPVLGGMTFDNEQKWFYLIMGFVIMITFFVRNFARSKIGRAFVAIRDNDIAAEIMGINVFHYKVLAFLLSSVFAGVGGSLLVHYMGVAQYEHYTLLDSIWFLGMLIIGGMGSVPGVIFGVIFLKTLNEFTLAVCPAISSAFPGLAETITAALGPIVFGTVIILFLVFEPRGLAHRWEIVKSSMRIWPFPH
jgi:branched-chain amino acid transport system permease protein